MIENIFGSVLRKYRKINKLSQEELAFRAGIDRSFLSELETGVRKPTINTLFTLSYALQIRPSKIISEVENEYEKLNESNNI